MDNKEILGRQNRLGTFQAKLFRRDRDLSASQRGFFHIERTGQRINVHGRVELWGRENDQVVTFRRDFHARCVVLARHERHFLSQGANLLDRLFGFIPTSINGACIGHVDPVESTVRLIMGEQGTHQQEFVPLIGGGGCSHDRVHKVMQTIIGQERTTQFVFFDRELIVIFTVDPVKC